MVTEQGKEWSVGWHGLSLIVPGVTLAGNLVGGPWAWLGGLMVWGILPAIEFTRPDVRKAAELTDGPFVEGLLFGHVLLQLANLAALLALAAGGPAWWVLVGAVFSTGSSSAAAAIVVAHEYMHRTDRFSQLCAYLLLVTVNYIHYAVEHVNVHHLRVGTDEDPASARRTDNPYWFVLTSVMGQIRHSWSLAWRKFGRQRQGRRVPFLVTMLVWQAIDLGLIVAIGLLLGPVALVAFMVQAALAVFMLEIVNYVEHWGLRRAPGERVRAEHSWETNSFLSRFTLIELGLHPDHHAKAAKPYHKLVSREPSPQMPYGLYASAVLLLVPALFRRVYAPVLEQYLAREGERLAA